MVVAPDDVRRSGEAALQRLKSAEPPLYLSPLPELAKDARAASAYLFSALLPFCATAPPVDRLLVDEDFDAEQIWGQISLVSTPLLSLARRELGRLEREVPKETKGVEKEKAIRSAAVKEMDVEIDEEEEMDVEGDEEEEMDVEGDEEEDSEDGGDEDGDEEKEEEEEEEELLGVEDRFLKIKELEEYLEKGDKEEYGIGEGKRKKQRKEEVEEEEDDDDDDEDGDEFELGDYDEDSDEENDPAEDARYDDFFGRKKKVQQKVSNKKKTVSSDQVDFGYGSEDMEDDQNYNEGGDALSTHEKELQKLQSKIEELEKANLEPKAWTMQGEVTAAKRPKNSALEVDLDFEHNVRPAPVITEEVTASLEDLIKKRILEGQFDDVQRAPVVVAKAPKELKELDENKSKKGLAEIYEEEYAQKTGLAPVSLSASDGLKKEASMLFKKLSLKLDALSHFHFAPKPVIEDMSIQSNVPALAMEEIAPVAVSDAAMLAPEEVFKGTGDIKEESELTGTDRKRRRANKKRKFKAISNAKREVKKVEPAQTSGD